MIEGVQRLTRGHHREPHRITGRKLPGNPEVGRDGDGDDDGEPVGPQGDLVDGDSPHPGHPRIHPPALLRGQDLHGVDVGVAVGAGGAGLGAVAATIAMEEMAAVDASTTLFGRTYQAPFGVSPVGLSYISKLAPARLLGLMFGVWFLNTSIANKIAGSTGSYIDAISNQYSMSVFFLIFTVIPIGAGLVLMLLNPLMKKWMHGVH